MDRSHLKRFAFAEVRVRASAVNPARIEALTEDTPAHLSAAEIYDRIHPRLSTVHPYPVYRALNPWVRAADFSIPDWGSGEVVFKRLEHTRRQHRGYQSCGIITTRGHDEKNLFLQPSQMGMISTPGPSTRSYLERTADDVKGYLQ